MLLKITVIGIILISAYLLFTYCNYKNYHSLKATVIDIIPIKDKFEKNIINYKYKLSFLLHNKIINVTTYDVYSSIDYSIGDELNILYEKETKKINYLEDKHSNLFFLVLRFINKMQKRGL